MFHNYVIEITFFFFFFFLAFFPKFYPDSVHFVITHVKIQALTLCMLGINFSRWHFEIRFTYFFFHNIGFDIACKLSLRGQFA